MEDRIRHYIGYLKYVYCNVDLIANTEDRIIVDVYSKSIYLEDFSGKDFIYDVELNEDHIRIFIGKE